MDDTGAQLAAAEKLAAQWNAEVVKLRSQQILEQQLSPAKQFAIALHSATCNSDHTEQCDWFYSIKDGVHDWNGWAHRRYLDKGKRLERIGAAMWEGKKTAASIILEVIAALKG